MIIRLCYKFQRWRWPNRDARDQRSTPVDLAGDGEEGFPEIGSVVGKPIEVEMRWGERREWLGASLYRCMQQGRRLCAWHGGRWSVEDEPVAVAVSFGTRGVYSTAPGR
jgi:hypothetical protein